MGTASRHEAGVDIVVPKIINDVFQANKKKELIGVSR